jgi:hypothetical protein
MKKIVPFFFIIAIACTKQYQPKANALSDKVTAKSITAKNPVIRFSLDSLSTKPFFISCSNNQGESELFVDITTNTPIVIESYRFAIIGDTAEAFSVSEPLAQLAPAFFGGSGEAELEVTNDTIQTSRRIWFTMHYNNINGTTGRSGTTLKLMLEAVEYETIPGGNLTFHSLNQFVEGNTMELVDAAPIITLNNPKTIIGNGVTQIAEVEFQEDGDKPIVSNIPLEITPTGSVQIDKTVPFVVKNNGVKIKTKTHFEENGKVDITLPTGFTTGLLQIYATLKAVSTGDQLYVMMQPPQNFSWLDVPTANNPVPFTGEVNRIYKFGYPVNSFTLVAQ